MVEEQSVADEQPNQGLDTKINEQSMAGEETTVGKQPSQNLSSVLIFLGIFFVTEVILTSIFFVSAHDLSYKYITMMVISISFLNISIPAGFAAILPTGIYRPSWGLRVFVKTNFYLLLMITVIFINILAVWAQNAAFPGLSVESPGFDVNVLASLFADPYRLLTSIALFFLGVLFATFSYVKVWGFRFPYV